MKTQSPTEIYWTSAQQIFLANSLCQKDKRLRVTVVKANSLRFHQASSASHSFICSESAVVTGGYQDRRPHPC